MDELFDYYQETQPLEEEEKKVMKFKAKYEYQQSDFLANKIVKLCVKVQIFFAGFNVITFYVTHLRQGLIPFISIFFKFARFVYVTQLLILELITKDRRQKQMDSRVLRVRVT